MNRHISITSVSLVVIAAALVVLAAVPAERDRVRSAIKNVDFHANVGQQARERPWDPDALLALAAAWTPYYGPKLPDVKAYRPLFKLKPDWAAAYLLLGYGMVSAVPLDQPRELAASGQRTYYAGTQFTRRQRQEAATTARTVLQEARALDPTNAAPDYLLAYLALAEHRDDDALGLLRSAMRKNHWSIGERETCIARYKANARRMPPLEAAMFARVCTFVPRKSLRDLARVVTGMAVLAERGGDAKRAIFLRESVMHLGELMMAEGYTSIEVFDGRAVWAIGSSEPLTPAESAAATKGLPKPKPRESGERTQPWNLALRKARLDKTVRYLRAHGRAELAERIVSFGRAYPARQDLLSRVVGRDAAEVTILLRLMLGFRQALFALAAAMILAAVCGLASLALVVLRRRPRPIIWARWKWALLIVACLVGPLAIAAAHAGWRPGRPLPGLSNDDYELDWLRPAPVMALGLLVVSTLVVTWRLRRRAGMRNGVPGFGRHYVGTLAAVAVPLTAVVALGCLAVSVPLVLKARERAQHYRTMIYHGELDYIGRQQVGEMPTNRPPQ